MWFRVAIVGAFDLEADSVEQAEKIARLRARSADFDTVDIDLVDVTAEYDYPVRPTRA